jgi:hypothetical protein
MTKSQGFWIIGLLCYILGAIKGFSPTEKWMPFICAALGLYFIIKAIVQNRKEESALEDAQVAWQEASKKGDHN